MGSLEEKVAWITGAGSGIGQAGALALAAAGANAVLSGRTVPALNETAARIRTDSGKARVEPLDVCDADAVKRVADTIHREYGRIDILVNSAGVNIVNRHWQEVTGEDWKHVVDINLNGAFHCVSAVLPRMRGRGDGLIINIASWAGRYDTYVSGPSYNAAKHAMLAMNASLNIEEGKNGIRACAICPGEVATPILDKRPVPVSPEDKAKMLQTEDLGETILYVARLPARVCVNELLISPTWNRIYLKEME
jgi:NADP-dependent 3-hydroxy acid dehydrogenase YdfG